MNHLYAIIQKKVGIVILKRTSVAFFKYILQIPIWEELENYRQISSCNFKNMIWS